MSATPVGYLYTPQQLMGSVKYGSGVLLGNWREDDALDEMRLAEHGVRKATGSLTLWKQQAATAPMVTPTTLSSAHADGFVHSGDVLMLQSYCNGGCLAVSLGQKLRSLEATMYSCFCGTSTAPVMRNTLTIMSWEGGEGPICYGQKLCLAFAAAAGKKGLLASQRSGRSQMSSQIISKQEVYYLELDAEAPTPYMDCAWEIQTVDMDERIISQGKPVPAGAPIILTHCFTNHKLAGLQLMMPSSAVPTSKEMAVCCHTFTSTGKVNKLLREQDGKPSTDKICHSEAAENVWALKYA